MQIILRKVLEKPLISGLMLREIQKIRPKNYHEFRILKFMVKLETLCMLCELERSERETMH